MIQTLAMTTNFVIQFNDAFPFAKQRAQKLQQSAEAELATLRSWFENTIGFGAANPVTLLVLRCSQMIQLRTNGPKGVCAIDRDPGESCVCI